jgi:hypothetical protein
VSFHIVDAQGLGEAAAFGQAEVGSSCATFPRGLSNGLPSSTEHLREDQVGRSGEGYLIEVAVVLDRGAECIFGHFWGWGYVETMKQVVETM